MVSRHRGPGGRRAAGLTGPDAAEPLWDVPAPHDDRIRLSLRLIPYGDEQRLLVIRDISRLVGLEQVRQNFVANASHELRTPLTVLRGYLDMLGPQDVHPRWHDALAELRPAVDAADDLFSPREEMGRCIDAAEGHRPTEDAVFFNQEGAGTDTACLNGGHSSCRSSTENNHIIFMLH